jgi:PAS domain S-box-containing protein
VVVAFAVAVCTMTVVGTLSLRSLEDMRVETELRNRASQTLVSLGSLLANTLDAETGERGYLLTGSSPFLDPFRSAVANLSRDTAGLAQLAHGDSLLAPDLAAVSSLIGQQLAGLDSAIRMQNEGKVDSVRARVLARNNKSVMDQIRARIATIQITLSAERERRSGQLVATAARTRTIVIVSTALTLALLGLAAIGLASSIRAQARSEQATRDAEARLSAILEQMPVGVLVVDPEGVPQFANRVAKQILGNDVGPESVVDRMPEIYQVHRSGSSEIYPAADLPIARALRGEAVYDAGIDLHSADGVVPVEAWASPVRDQSGKLVLAVAAFSDISERLAAERALKDSERKLQQILDSIPLGITVADHTGTPTFVNAAGRKLLSPDLPPHVAISELSRISRVFVAGTREPYPSERRGITRALRGEASYADDLEVHTPERIVPLEVWSAPVYDSSGNLAMAISAYGDITGRVESERRVRESEQRLQKILDSIPLGITVADPTGTVTFLNEAGRKLLGRSLVEGLPNAQLSETYRVFVRGTDELYPAERRGINRALRGERTYADDLEFRGPERNVPIEIWTAPVYDSLGGLIMTISAYGDISDRLASQRRIEGLTERLSSRVEELAAVNQELESFSYSVAHDLRAPLRAISGFCGMLIEDYSESLDAEGIRLLGVVRDSAIRMGHLIDDLLSLSRLTRARLTPTEVDMTGLAASAAEELLQTFPHGTRPPEIGVLPRAHGDATLLRQVWANLLSNALKYSRNSAEPRVEVGSIDGSPAQGNTVYFVRDNGVGFDMAHADKLFGVFQRLHRTDEFEGTGVGLAIVYRVLTRHGGRIWAESSPGRGATFYFTLPSDPERQ